MRRLGYLLLVSFMLPAGASNIVRTAQEEAFNCDYAERAAREDLEKQCVAKGYRLGSCRVIKCDKTGDDGSYVTYYTAWAEGRCVD